MPIKAVVLLLSAAGLAACATSNVTPLANDVVMISTSAAPACGRQGAQRVALREAAAETLRRGYDTFVVVGAESASHLRVVGRSPVTSNTAFDGSIDSDSFGSTFSGTARTTYSGGAPIIGGTFEQDFAIRMFRQGDPGSENAIDARITLGPDWAEAVANPRGLCF